MKDYQLHTYLELPVTESIHSITTDEYENIYVIMQKERVFEVGKWDGHTLLSCSIHLEKAPDFFRVKDGFLYFLYVIHTEKSSILKVYQIDGRKIKEFLVGDAVQVCEIDEKANLWIGYFDEGIFSEDPLSQQGLVSFSNTGHPLYLFNEISESNQVPHIDECYAACSTGESIWVCYYSGSTILAELDANKEVSRIFTLDIGAVSQVVVGKRFALLVTTDETYQLDLETGKMRDVHLSLRKNEKASPDHIFARNNKLYCLYGNFLYSLTIQ